MLLTITLKGAPKGMQSARDIGLLLHKNPDNMHCLAISFGKVYVFYPQATNDCCVAALLLDVDPVKLVRKGKVNDNFALEQYVNDRPSEEERAKA